MSEFVITEDFPHNQLEFEQRFGSEQACRDYLARLKWPEGFTCRRCGHSQCWISARHLYICSHCQAPHSVTAGTVMHATKKPLTFWFKAMWWFTTRKSGINAVNLQDLLGLGSYQTAWLWLHKLRRCTIRRGREPLSGRVEVDEFFLGGQQPGTRGRGANGKTIVVAALEKRGSKVGRLRLIVVPSCGGDVLEPMIASQVAPGSAVATDGWAGYLAIDATRYHHQPVNARKAADKNSVLPGVHLVISLVRRLMMGTYQGRFGPSHLQSYLDEFVFRFNRRKSRNVGKKFMRITQQVMASTKTRYRDIVGGRPVFSLLAN